MTLLRWKIRTGSRLVFESYLPTQMIVEQGTCQIEVPIFAVFAVQP